MFNPFKKMKSDADLDESLPPEADAFIADACREYDLKTEALLKGEWRLETCEKWDFDNDTGVVTVRFSDGSQWQADAQWLGSYCLDDQTFQWGWDSPDVSEQLKRDSFMVKEFGERFGINYLVRGGGCFPLYSPDVVDYLCAIALKATNSEGVMEAPAENMAGLIMLKNLRWANAAA